MTAAIDAPAMPAEVSRRVERDAVAELAAEFRVLRASMLRARLGRSDGAPLIVRLRTRTARTSDHMTADLGRASALPPPVRPAVTPASSVTNCPVCVGLGCGECCQTGRA